MKLEVDVVHVFELKVTIPHVGEEYIHLAGRIGDIARRVDLFKYDAMKFANVLTLHNSSSQNGRQNHHLALGSP